MSDGTEQIETLEMEVKIFANSLPYWGKYLCSKLLAGSVLSDSDIEAAYSYLSQDLELIEKIDNPVITLNYNENTSEDYKGSLLINTLQNVEGVNALSENQTIEFSPDITIIYGANGSGKSGYVRLLKNVFYSKHKEEILTNVHEDENNKQISAEFSFLSDTTDISLKYPDHSSNGIFKQFSVFDGVVALRHLENRNVFEFRPSGLSLFSQFNGAIDALQHKLDSEIALISLNNPYAVIFEEQSVISQLIHSLSSSSDINDLKRHSSFTEKHALIKQKYDKKYDDLKILLSSKDEQIKLLVKVKDQIERVKQNLEGINSNFMQEYLDKIPDAITNCLEKQKIAKEEGIENFSSEEIQSIGSIEWKEFIEAAEKFALKQKNPIYPQIGDNCLLCHQPIEKEQQELISSYWDFLKSVAEQESKDALILIDKLKNVFQKIEFDQFPHDNTLTEWLNENYPDTLADLLNNLAVQEELANIIIQNLEYKQLDKYTSVQTDIKSLSEIELVINSKIKNIQEGELSKELDKVLKPKTYLTHKQKLSDRIKEIEELYSRMLWVSKANNFNKQYWKGNTTRTEKRLSNKYFNEEYIKVFNEECNYLNGNFGIEIDAKSSDAQSNRQLFLKGKKPSLILSEGEQKVIAIADFLAETKLSIVNKGIVFDDPVNSLDEERKSTIAERLVAETKYRQVVIFTHDLVFLSSIINYCSDYDIQHKCHWIEKLDDEIGKIWLDNTPSYEKQYKTSGIAQKLLEKAKGLPPEEREAYVKMGFSALRSSYEAFVIFDLLAGVVQRFNDRVSVDSLSGIYIDDEIINEIKDNFGLACRYMEGHVHSDKFLSKKPTPDQLDEEIQRFNSLKKKLKLKKKQVAEN